MTIVLGASPVFRLFNDEYESSPKRLIVTLTHSIGDTVYLVIFQPTSGSLPSTPSGWTLVTSWTLEWGVAVYAQTATTTSTTTPSGFNFVGTFGGVAMFSVKGVIPTSVVQGIDSYTGDNTSPYYQSICPAITIPNSPHLAVFINVNIDRGIQTRSSSFTLFGSGSDSIYTNQQYFSISTKLISTTEPAFSSTRSGGFSNGMFLNFAIPEEVSNASNTLFFGSNY